MLVDAIRSETYRLSRNPMTLFWSVGFVPLMYLAGSLVFGLFMKSKTDAMAGQLPDAILNSGPLNLTPDIVSLFGFVANPAVITFTMIGAATLFAGDYRWETWRLITARNSRFNLLMGKIGTALLLALLAMATMYLSGLLSLVVKIILTGKGATLGFQADDFGHMGLLFGISLTHICQCLVLSLLAATISRSIMAAIFVPIVWNIAQSIGEKFAIIFGLMPNDWRTILMFPGLAIDHLKSIALMPVLTEAQSNLIMPSAFSLLLWIAVPIALALILFQRQGLSKE